MNLARSSVRLVATVVVLAAAIGATAVLLTPASGAARHSVTLHFREPTVNGSAINAAGKPNQQGDYLSWDDPLKDVKTGKLVGRVAGICILVDVKSQVFDCGPVTYILKGGTIVGDGLLYGNGKRAPGVIVGGTGKYRDARGVLTVYAPSSAITDHVIKLDNN